MATDSAMIWVVDDDRSIRWVLERALEDAGLRVRSFESAELALAAIGGGAPQALLTDIRMPGTDGLALLERLGSDHPAMPVIIMTAHSDLDSAVSAYQGGAFEYLPKPFDIDEAVALVERAVEHSREVNGLDEGVPESVPEIIGESPAMQEVFRAIGRLARSTITVLSNGESGTGKELVALALHRHSPRATAPFVALNMAAIPRDLLESELFGHERGAFTGAQTRRQGRFEQADGGTLFLDEIGDMPQELQTRLLRVLAEGAFFRVGGHEPVKVDVRIIAATHQDLEARVRDGAFREDLFHRLNVIRIQIPALRERREDIARLARHLLQLVAVELQVEAKRLQPETEAWLSGLDWPGNVRQRENLCRWLTVMSSVRDIRIEDLPDELRDAVPELSGDAWQAALRQWALQRIGAGAGDLAGSAMAELERVLIDVALEQTAGHRQEAARLLGWGRNTLTRKIREHGIGDT